MSGGKAEFKWRRERDQHWSEVAKSSQESKTEKKLEVPVSLLHQASNDKPNTPSILVTNDFTRSGPGQMEMWICEICRVFILSHVMRGSQERQAMALEGYERLGRVQGSR